MELEHFTNTSLAMALNDVQKALDAKLFYLALVMTLTLPDICAALESEDGQGGREKYKPWYNTHLSAHYPGLTADDCWGLRCGMVHQGHVRAHTKSHQSKWSRVVFSLPFENSIGTFHIKGFSREAPEEAHFMTGLAEFCLDVVMRVKLWANAEKYNPIVKKNAEHLMRLYPQGVAPFASGIALFA